MAAFSNSWFGSPFLFFNLKKCDLKALKIYIPLWVGSRIVFQPHILYPKVHSPSFPNSSLPSFTQGKETFDGPSELQPCNIHAPTCDRASPQTMDSLSGKLVWLPRTSSLHQLALPRLYRKVIPELNGKLDGLPLCQSVTNLASGKSYQIWGHQGGEAGIKEPRPKEYC